MNATLLPSMKFFHRTTRQPPADAVEYAACQHEILDTRQLPRRASPTQLITAIIRSPA